MELYAYHGVCALLQYKYTLKMRVSRLSWRLSSEEAACSAGDPGSTPNPWRSHVPGSDGVRVPRVPQLGREPALSRGTARSVRHDCRKDRASTETQHSRNRHKQAKFLKIETSSQILLPVLTNSFSVRRGRSLWKYQWKFFQEVFLVCSTISCKVLQISAKLHNWQHNIGCLRILLSYPNDFNEYNF